MVVTGATGLVGSALTRRLRADGARVVAVSRSGVRDLEVDGEVRWDPRAGELDPGGLAGADAVVHLAGENIAGGRWSDAFKERIRASRVEGTRLLAETLAGLDAPPGVMVCACAVGYYGDRGDEVLTEESAPGEGFLAEVCQQWEAAAEPARSAGIRVVHLRTGMVLAREGGALAKMYWPFRLGVGGVLGSGEQFMSWIELGDFVKVILHALAAPDLAGAVNAVAPRPVTNRAFTKALGRVLGRPTLLPVPAFALRLAVGEMADALLLASTRVEPAVLAGRDFEFRHPEIEGALAAALAPAQGGERAEEP